MRRWLTLAVTGIGLIIAGCNGSNSNSSTASTPSTMTVPLTYSPQASVTSHLASQVSSNVALGLHMPVTIGNNSVNVAVDTGSVGLRIMESSLANLSDIKVSTIPVSYDYINGITVKGVVATAPVTIGQVTIPLTFMLVKSVTCQSAQPNCPAASFSAAGRVGVIGVRLDSAGTSQGIWSPLGQLPGSLSNGFVISGNQTNPQLTIGITLGQLESFNLVQLAAESPNTANPAPYSLWNPYIAGGISYPLANGSLSTATTSGKILYNSGGSVFTIFNVTAGASGDFATGKTIQVYHTLNNGNNYNWQLQTGTQAYVNTADKSSVTSTLIADSGNIPFTQLDIVYSIESGLMGFKPAQVISPVATTAQMIYSDSYACNLLPICPSNNPGDLTCVSQKAYNHCISLQSLNQSGLTLNDSNNLYVAMFQHQTGSGPYSFPQYMSLTNPTTLFAAFTITYSPDGSAQANYVGWPYPSTPLQQDAYSAGSGNTCEAYSNNSITSHGPWLSHCSSFTAFAESLAYGVIVPPIQPRGDLGYDWCGLADANYTELTAGANGWTNVTNASLGVAAPVAAQILANQGCAVVANYHNDNGAGHIAPILPSTWSVAKTLQQSSNYPRDVLVTDSNGVANFTSLLEIVGPEEMQAGLYNFQHTVVLNGFFSEFKGSDNFSAVNYFYNPASCNQ